ncbi:MAG: phosphatase PAP2 family protein [Propionibacteriaceae bacterium]|nr:phosphatase PAP2 family protein [Propionibacteriaceae bacterium]
MTSVPGFRDLSMGGVRTIVRARRRRLLRGVVAMGCFAVPVLLLAFAVRQQLVPLIDADKAAIRAATGFTRSHGLRSALIILQDVSQPVCVYVAATVVVVWAWVAKNLKGRALWAFVTMMVGWIIGGVSKVIVQRARPVLDDPVSHSSGYSFPSGHALNITVAASVMVFLLWPLLSTVGRRTAVASAAVVVLIVGLDRIFLGVHFPSDVFAGFVLGLGITLSSWIGFIGRTAASSSLGPSHPA